MSHALEVILCRSISLDHPRWNRDQVLAAAREAAKGRGPYALLCADLQAAADE